jgi:hypothetical protein
MCIVIKNMGGFPLAVSHSLHQEEYDIDFSGMMSKGKLWATHFLLALLSRGVVGAPVRLLRVSRCTRLMHVADQWARPPLSVRMAPIAAGS